MTDNNRKQALIPDGAHIFENRFGTADGLGLSDGKKTLVLMPGPPNEMRPMFENEVLPYLAARNDHVLVSSNVNVFGMGESAVENALADLMKSSENPTVAPYIGGGEVRLRRFGTCRKREEGAGAYRASGGKDTEDARKRRVWRGRAVARKRACRKAESGA